MTVGREGGCKAASGEVFSGGFQENILESAYSAASLSATGPGSVALADKCTSVRGKQRHLSQWAMTSRGPWEAALAWSSCLGPRGRLWSGLQHGSVSCQLGQASRA